MVCTYKFGQRDTERLYCHLLLNVSGVISAESGITLLCME